MDKKPNKEIKEDSPYDLYEKHKPEITKYFKSFVPARNKAFRACLLEVHSKNLIEPSENKSEEIKKMEYEYIETTSLEDMTKQIALKQKEGWELDGDTQPFHWDRKQYNDTYPQQKYLQRVKKSFKLEAMYNGQIKDDCYGKDGRYMVCTPIHARRTNGASD